MKTTGNARGNQVRMQASLKGKDQEAATFYRLRDARRAKTPRANQNFPWKIFEKPGGRRFEGSTGRRVWNIAIAQDGAVPSVSFCWCRHVQPEFLTLLVPACASGLTNALLSFWRLPPGAHLRASLAKQDAAICITRKVCQEGARVCQRLGIRASQRSPCSGNSEVQIQTKRPPRGLHDSRPWALSLPESVRLTPPPQGDRVIYSLLPWDRQNANIHINIYDENIEIKGSIRIGTRP